MDRRLLVMFAMVLTVIAVVGLAVWDQRREAENGLGELRQEQATLAAALGAHVREQVRGARRGEALLEGLRPLERAGDLEVFLVMPERAGLLGVDGGVVAGEALRQAALRGEVSWVLARDEAPAFGLPRRMAVAGLHRFEENGQAWGVVTVTSARSLRDRWYRAELRLVLGGGLVGLVVVAFGGLLLRGLRKELELERKLNAQERDALLAKADKMAMLAALGTGIAHEIASPLGVIAARVEQLQARGPQDERIARPLGIIAEQVQRIHAVMRGVLALARGESPTLERVEPERLVAASAEQARHRFEAARISLAQAVSPGLPAVACDARLIEQAMVNALLNAVGAAGVTRVEVGATERAGRVCFFIEDDGDGMSAETIQQATRPFFTTKGGQGTGLGLAISREIVKHHQGNLSLISSPAERRGTRVEIELPVAS